ncbi:hypothetical protein ACHAWF_013017 [Thalassiosira exigua]
MPTSTSSNLRPRGRKLPRALTSIFFLCPLLAGPACYAFHQPFRPASWQSSSPGSPTGVRSTASSADPSVASDVDDRDGVSRETRGGGGRTSGVELWLDLRGTSLTPKTAMELWDLEDLPDDAQHDQSDQLDQQHVYASSHAPFAKYFMSLDKDCTNQNNGDGGVGVLLLADDGDEDMRTITMRKSDGSLDVVGRIISLQMSSSMPILPDPLPAMEAFSNGDWIVLDTSGWSKIAEEERMDMILPLAELISSGMPGSANGGGIGLTCRTKNEVVKAAMFVQSMTNGGSGRGSNTKTLESGIVIPDDDLTVTEHTQQGNRIGFSLIVPYDMALLRTAMLLLGECQDDGQS